MKYLAFCIVLLFAGTTYAANGALNKTYECIPIVEKHKLIKKLEEKTGEVSLFRAMSRKGPHMIEVFVNLTTGTWTAIGTDTLKVCILDFGAQGEVTELGKHI